MVNELHNHIQTINDALAWIKENKPADYKAKFINLIQQRRQLKVIQRASCDNPAIAAFGKSQVGKSYLMSCMLQERDSFGCIKSFKVSSNGKEYDFIKQVNPIGDGKEATGVVTRFSSFKRSKGKYSSEYPVLVRCLSMADVVTILCDSYFNDIANYSTPSESEIKDAFGAIVSRYSNQPDVASPVITSDEILGMKEYFKKYVNNAQIFDNCSFFSEISLVIEKVPLNDYINVFKVLWNGNENISRLFVCMLDILRGLNFAEYVYLPIDAVLHEGIKENTVMSVECLKRLLNTNNTSMTDVFAKDGATYKKLGSFSKSAVCAVTSEVIYKIEDSFLESRNSYCMDGISSTVRPQINGDKITMSILKDNDLLDFPGARSRLNEDSKNLEKESVLMECFLRSKVAYLFNKYNESFLINVLLYCHHNTDNDVPQLWRLLDGWVRNNVGNTPEKRSNTIRSTKISPLFYVGTMFNLDMKMRDSEVENNENAITNRWKGRFETVLNNQCFRRESVEWVKNWCANGNFFKNSYLLRDYKFSGIGESGLYDGFGEFGEERSLLLPSEYYSRLRETFVRNASVKELFDYPEMAWDLAATKNNDGSLYIIENLQIVASVLDNAREIMFREKCQTAVRKVHDEIKDYYVSTDKNLILESNIRKAKRVFRELSFTCNTDNYYFGHLIQALQITEVKVYKMLHDEIMQNPDLLNSPNVFINYEIIRKDCENCGYPLEKCTSTEESWSSLMETYSFIDKAEALDYLAKRNVDPIKLFDSKQLRNLKNSNVIAEYIYTAWCDGLRSVEFMNTFAGERSFDGGVMVNLIDNIIETSVQIGLSDKIASNIADLVDVVDIHTVNEELVSDVVADIINAYVLDLGYSAYDDTKIETIRKSGEMFNLPIFNYIEKEREHDYSEEKLTELFNTMSVNPVALIPSFEEHYYKWIEYMYISFIANIDVPLFNIAANNELKAIIDKLHSMSVEKK